MSDAGKKLLEGAAEALAVAKGDQPAARIRHSGHAYVPESELATLRSEYLAASKDAMDAHGEINRLRARVEELEREREERPKVGEWMRLIKREKARANRLQSLLDEARKALEEFGNPRNWVVNGRFDPHSGNFVATTFARAALSRITETMGESDG